MSSATNFIRKKRVRKTSLFMVFSQLMEYRIICSSRSYWRPTSAIRHLSVVFSSLVSGSQEKFNPWLCRSHVTAAAYFVSNAKQLRGSADIYTRKTVFINPDLTKVEAQADYEKRVNRRLLGSAHGSTRGRTFISSTRLTLNTTSTQPVTSPGDLLQAFKRTTYVIESAERHQSVC